MAALGVITLILTSFTLVYYAYLANHTDRDVSFFLSVGIISIIMNFCTNAGGVFGLAWLYLVVAVVFLGVGWAVDVQGSLGFYTSIGPWFKNTFTNTQLIGWQVLSTILFPAGIVLYFVNYKSQGELAKACGRSALLGVILWAMLLWAILGLVL